jgi:hypothetical protein
MARRARCWQVHSALAQKVNAIGAINDRLHAACEGIQSGQLPVLGSCTLAHVSTALMGAPQQAVCRCSWQPLQLIL